VPWYFLSLRYKDGPQGLAVDDEGDDLPDPLLLREDVLETARDLIPGRWISGINWVDCPFEVTEEAGQLVLTVPPSDTVGNS
jgi:hypothetical protein